MPKQRTLSLVKTTKKQSKGFERKAPARPRAQLMNRGPHLMRSLSSHLTVREYVNNNASQPLESPGSPMGQSLDCSLFTSLIEPVKNSDKLLPSNEDSSELNTLSLHEFIQQAETRLDDAVVAQEDLSRDLTLFKMNIRQAITNQGKRPQELLKSKVVLEYQSEGIDFLTVFKSFEILRNKNQDILISSIVSNLRSRSFLNLETLLISYFSKQKQCFVAAARLPVPTDAVIPAEDIEQGGRLILKIWPNHKIQHQILAEIEESSRLRVYITGSEIAEALNPGCKIGLDCSFISEFEMSLSQVLQSLPSTTSANKNVDNDNTIDQLLGKTSPKIACKRRDSSHDSYEQQRQFQRQIDEGLIGQDSPVRHREISRTMKENAAENEIHAKSRILGITKLVPMRRITPIPLQQPEEGLRLTAPMATSDYPDRLAAPIRAPCSSSNEEGIFGFQLPSVQYTNCDMKNYLTQMQPQSASLPLINQQTVYDIRKEQRLGTDVGMKSSNPLAQTGPSRSSLNTMRDDVFLTPWSSIQNRDLEARLAASNAKSAKSRIKERTIQEVVEKVSLWRLLYTGYQNNGSVVKVSLEEAAQKVRISKKSLDDYLMQLRSAKRFGFDFEKHSHEKVGVIRSFVRKKKEEERKRIDDQGKRSTLKKTRSFSSSGQKTAQAQDRLRKTRQQPFKPHQDKENSSVKDLFQTHSTK